LRSSVSIPWLSFLASIAFVFMDTYIPKEKINVKIIMRQLIILSFY